MDLKKKTKWVWNEDVPSHLTAFLDSTKELDLLTQSHLSYLFNEVDNDIIKEKETIFLRAAVTLLCSTWEAFVEDLLRNGMEFLIDNIDDDSKIPKNLKKQIASEIKNDKHELSPWNLSGNKWKDVVRNYLNKRIESLNTPKSSNIKLLYKEFLDIDILEEWEWVVSEGMESSVNFDRNNNIVWIDKFVTLRGAIAHGRKGENETYKFALDNIIIRLMKISSLMHNRILIQNYYVVFFK